MAERILYGLSNQTFRSIQFGAGAVFKNLEYQDVNTMANFNTLLTTAAAEGQMLGATDGGVEVSVQTTYGRPSVDGLGQIPFKGGLLPETVECYMSMTLKEISPSKMQSIFPTSRFAMETGSSAISQRINVNISDEDYYDNVTWVGTTQFGYIMIALLNAFGRVDGSLSAVDGIAGTGIPYRADGNVANFDDIEYVPAEVVYFYSNPSDATTEFEKIDTYRVLIAPPGP